MHRHRPAASAAQSLFADLDKAHGFLWWCNQNALHFGSDRRLPTAARMTLSLRRGPQTSVVLPATTQPKPAFFALDPARLRMHRSGDARASWLCPRYETIDNRQLQEAGIVDQAMRVQIVQWLRTGMQAARP